MGPLLVLAVIAPLWGSCPYTIGMSEFALKELSRCPAAVKQLGTPIEREVLGWNCGEKVGEGSQGSLHWTFPVKGPMGRGQYSYSMEAQENRWHLFKAELEIGDRKTDVMACLYSSPETPAIIRVAAAGVRQVALDLQRRCDDGDANACLAAGSLFLSGDPSVHNPVRAREDFAVACRKGIAAACALQVSVADGGP